MTFNSANGLYYPENPEHVMECPVFGSHWEGQMTLHPVNGMHYCPKHVITCTTSGCQKKFFDWEYTPDVSCGAHCISCPHEGAPYWCDEHVPECQLCDNDGELCVPCTVEATRGKYTSLCEHCCEGVMDDPFSLALVKRAVSKYESV